MRAQYYQCLVVLLALALSACGGSSSPTSPSPTTPSPYITFSGPQTFAPGQSGQLTAAEVPATGAPVDVTTLAQWRSSDATVATVSNSGLVKAVAPGSATITAAYQGASSTYVVSVTRSNLIAAVVITGVGSIGINTGTQLFASASQFAGGTADVTTAATWQSSNPRVAVVNAGIVTGLSQGTAQITALYNGVIGTFDITVVDAVSSVLVIGSQSILSGTSTPQPLTAAAVMAIGPERVVTNLASWSSSDPGVATVSATGGVTPVAVGTTTISATYNGVTGSLDVTVH